MLCLTSVFRCSLLWCWFTLNTNGLLFVFSLVFCLIWAPFLWSSRVVTVHPKFQQVLSVVFFFYVGVFLLVWVLYLWQVLSLPFILGANVPNICQNHMEGAVA